MIPLQQIFKELFAQKTRLLLTILAIAWGTFSITTMLSIGEGLRMTFAKTVANTGTQMLTIKGSRTSQAFRGMHGNIPISLTHQDLNAISTLPNVARITPQYTLSTKLKLGDKELPQAVLAVSPSYKTIHTIPIQRGGRFISPVDQALQNHVIVLGYDVAKSFSLLDKNPVGKTILMNKIPFLIVGIMQPKTQLAAGRTAPDTFMAWIPSRTYEAFNNPTSIDNIALTYINPNKLQALKDQIVRVVALNHHLDTNDTNIIRFSDSARRQTKINTFFIGMQIFLGLVGLLTLIVAGVGISNVMFASVQSATREIGVRMAIGARTYHILSHYIMESLFTAMIGGIVGLLPSVGIVYLLRAIPMHGKVFEVIGKPHPILSWSVVIIVVVILGLTGLLSGLFPALKASLIDPAEALSYE